MAILEAILLIICIGFLIFLILHFLVCSHKQHNVTSTTPYITTPAITDDDGNSSPNGGTQTEKYVFIHKADSYTGVVTIPRGKGTEKVIFIKKGVPSEFQIVYHVTSNKVTAEDSSRISHKDKENKLTTASTDAQNNGVIHKKVYINKEVASGNASGVGVSSLDGVTRKIIVINKETPVDKHDYFQSDDSKTSLDNNLNDDTTDGRESQHTTPTHTTSDLECSWHPLEKTVAPTHYYLKDKLSMSSDFIKRKLSKETGTSVLKIDGKDDTVMDYANMDASQASGTSNEKSFGGFGKELGLDALAYDDQSDGEESPVLYKNFVLALVKVKPSREVQFGCILTAISAYWTLTAASCIESIEEVDSLDTFVMMEGYGDYDPGRTYAVSDVQVHPLFQGANRSHDLAALRSEERLRRVAAGARLPTLLDYYTLTAAERLTVLGFGSFR